MRPTPRLDLDTAVTTGLAEVPDIGLADQRLLDQCPNLCVSTLDKDLRPENRFVGHRPLGKGKRPFTEPFIGPRAADRRDVEPIFDCLAHRNAVVRDTGPKDSKATFIDQFRIAIEDRLDRPFREAPGLTDDELDRAIDKAPLQAFFENQLKGEKEVVNPLFGMVLRHHPVHQDAELDGFGVRFVGQLAPLDEAPAGEPEICSKT